MEESHPLTYIPSFFLMFISIYLFGYSIVFRKWSSKIRPEASSCLISLFHGTPAVFLTAWALLSDPDRGFSARNTRTQNAVLEFSAAYFLADLLHFAVFSPTIDTLFIAHHAAVLFVFLTCRYVVFHGACGVLALLILAEATSACQNTWTLAGLRRQDLPFAARLHSWLSPRFYAFYSLCRGVLGPFLVCKMTWLYAGGSADDVIPKWAWLSWIVVIVSALAVSNLWIWNLWVELFTGERNAKSDKKTK